MGMRETYPASFAVIVAVSFHPAGLGLVWRYDMLSIVKLNEKHSASRREALVPSDMRLPNLDAHGFGLPTRWRRLSQEMWISVSILSTIGRRIQIT
jgi:hypothetical protein